MAIKNALKKSELIAVTRSGDLARRINDHRVETEQLEVIIPQAVRYYVVDEQMSYAKAGGLLGLSGERVRQIAAELGIKSRFARVRADDAERAERRALVPA